MNEVILYSVLMLVAVFVSSISQIILKKSSRKEYDNLLREYLNVKVISAYSMFFVATLMNVFAIKYIPLSLATVIESLGYVFISILGFYFLNEKLGSKKIIGIMMIIIGTIIYSL